MCVTATAIVQTDAGGYAPADIRRRFERHGVLIQEWDRMRTDWLAIRDGTGAGPLEPVA